MTGPSAPSRLFAGGPERLHPVFRDSFLAGAALAGGDDALGVTDRVVEVGVVGVRPQLGVAAFQHELGEAHVVGMDVGEDERPHLLERVAGGIDGDLERFRAARMPGAAAVDQGQLVALDQVCVDVGDRLPGEWQPQSPDAGGDLARAGGGGVDGPVGGRRAGHADAG